MTSAKQIPGKFIMYTRVSSSKQELSGLGLKAQKFACQKYIKDAGGELIAEYTEVQSASAFKEVISLDKPVTLESLLKKRPQLITALKHASESGAVLIFKEVSRLTRRKLLGEYLLASKVNMIAADSPTDTPMIISLKISLYEEEAATISRRTRAALAAKREAEELLPAKEKKQMVKRTGNPDYISGKVAKIGAAAASAISKKNPNNTRAALIICSKRKEGLSFQAIADQLNAAQYVTAYGKQFNAIQVQRIHQRFC
jgi:DNA invertase Pin-like site-specific DNA recombinase